MKPTTETNRTPGIFTTAYWRMALASFRSPWMLVFASLICALRVAVKLFRIPIAEGLTLSLDCYVNSLGSVVYGPVMGLLVGAVSDTLGCMLFPSGPYFFPFMFVEMSSSFIFALFLWRRRLTVPRVLLSKFTVNLVCNIILTSVIMKWDYYFFYGIEKAEAYAIINLVRIGKNLVLFPLEAMLIALVLQAAVPVLRRMSHLHVDADSLRLKWWHYIIIAGLLTVSVGLIAAYVGFGADFIKAHNFKLL